MSGEKMQEQDVPEIRTREDLVIERDEAVFRAMLAATIAADEVNDD